MTISNRAKVLAAGVLILIAIILILLFLRRPASDTEEAATSEEETFEVLEEEEEEPEKAPEPLTEERKQEISAGTVAGIFVERFGSYSSESDLANIEDVLELATTSYQSELRELVYNIREEGQSDTYYGVTTRVISKNRTAYDEQAGTASFDVVTQREESIGSVQESTVRYQTIQLELEKEDGVWKIASATWL